jgi:tetratricopeptide (TPR) repeat protein
MSKSANSVDRCASLLPLVVLATVLVSGCMGNSSRVQSATSGPIEHQLMAEIALQRGQYQIAVQEYLSLAQQSRNPDHARRATELAYEYGFDAYAQASAERWVELAPEEVLAHAYLGRLYVRSNQLDKAFTSLDIGLGPLLERTDADYMMLSAELGESVAPTRGLLVFNEFNRVYSDLPGILGGIATLAAQAGNYTLAVDATRQTLQLTPDRVIVRIWLAKFLLATGNKSSAFEQMAFALETNPGLDMELEFIQLLAAADEQKDALERLDRLNVRYPDNPELIRIRGRLAVKWGELDTAQADFSYLLSAAYFVNESFWYMGQIAYQQENYLQAIRYFKLVGSGAWLMHAKNAISQSYLALGDGEAALTVQREFAREYPKQAIAALRPQAEILAEMGRLSEALEVMDIAIEYKPWDERLWIFRGGLLEQSGQLDNAVESFLQAEVLAPNSALVLNALGYTMTIAGHDYDEAFEYIMRALTLEPHNPAIMDSLGWVYYRRGDQDEARNWLEQAYDLMPDPEIAAHLGEVLWVTGERDEAIQVWTGALLKYPDSQALNETTSRFLQ